MKRMLSRSTLVGRIGAEAAIALRNRPGGVLPDRRTRRARSRSDARRQAVAEASA